MICLGIFEKWDFFSPNFRLQVTLIFFSVKKKYYFRDFRSDIH